MVSRLVDLTTIIGARYNRLSQPAEDAQLWLRTMFACSGRVGLLTLSGTLTARQEPVFKTGNRTVAVYATVTNADGRFVPDLTRDAFAIFDNGKPQPLTLFANDIQPITVVILLDRSGSMRAKFALVEEAAEQFVAAMLPTDKARIGSFSNRIQVDPRDFTSDHDELLKILRTELQEEGPTPLWNAVNVGITALLHQQGRRVILVFTDGVDSPMNFSNTNNSLKDVMKRAEEEDVMVYAIGLAGENGPTAHRSSAAASGTQGSGEGGSGVEEQALADPEDMRRPTAVDGTAGRWTAEDRGGHRRRLLRTCLDERSRLDVRTGR